MARKDAYSLFIYPPLLIILLSFFMLAANPFKSETIAPMDLLVKYPAWHNTNLTIPYINGERSDVLDSKLPIWISAKRSLRAGTMPIWNYQRAGKPGLIFTNSLLTPAFMIFVVIKNDALGFYLSNLTNVLIGMFGMYFFLRLFLHKYASLFGAFIFMFSGFNAAWFFWAHVNTAIWTPWVLYAVYQYLQTGNKKFLPLVSFTILCLNLGGFPMVAVMTYMATGLMVILFFISFQIKVKRILSTLAYLFMFSLLSLLISLPFIYPLIELLFWMGGIDYRHGGSGFKLYDFQLFFNPNLYGTARVETTFYVGLLPLLFLLLALVLFIKKPTFLLSFGLVLFAYAVTIAFTLVSPELIHKIPTLNSSLLTRFGYLIGVSLAIVSAYVLHVFIVKFYLKKWLPIVILLIFILQVIDQGKLFHHFNNSVSNASFYPKTKTITHLQKNLQPFQYVLADNGFLISGTLGGYGLNDWYAHSFHSPAEKEILQTLVNNAFRTPTSAMFNFSDIDLESPYVDFLNIKAILATRYSKDKYISLWDNTREQSPAPVMPTNDLIQDFIIDEKINITGIALLSATYGEPHASSDVKLTLYKEGIYLDSALIKKDNIHDNTLVKFTFKNRLMLPKGNYSIHLKMLDITDAKALTFWTNNNETLSKLRVNSQDVNQSLKLYLTQDKKLSTHYNVLNLEPNIYIFENTHVKGGAYFLPALDINQNISHTYVQTDILNNTQIQIQYSGTQKGWIVLPMRSYPGWQATVNSVHIEQTKFLGMLPAIPVNGESKIIISYNPYYNIYTYSISIVSIGLILLSLYLFRKEDSL